MNIRPSRGDPRLFENIALFTALEEEQKHQVFKRSRRQTLREGEPLFHFGQPAQRFYVIADGRIKLFRVSENGNEKIIDILGPKQLVADMVMFMPSRCYPVNAAALADSEIFGFDIAQFRRLLRSSSKLCLCMLGNMGSQVLGLLDEIERLTLQSATLRLIHYLLEHVTDHQAVTTVVTLPAPKHCIAARLSITPETFSRILHSLEHEGLISIDGLNITITDPTRLHGYHDRPSPGRRSPILSGVEQ